MPLNLYRRHNGNCVGEHPEDSKSGELEERSKKWRRCDCQIFAAGTLGGKFRRRRTGKWNWEEAKVVATTWDAAGAWDITTSTAQAVIVKPAPAAITIIDATKAYMEARRNRGIAPPTVTKYQTMVNQLLEYCNARGYVATEQLTVPDMDRFYASWKDGKRSKAKKLERLKGFVRFCMKRKWLAENIAEDLGPPEGWSIPADEMPFTDAEMQRIYAACDKIGGPVAPGPGRRDWTGEDVKDFIMLSVYTGLRISDVSTFDIERRLNGNDVFLRMHKTRKELWTWIPDWLVARLRERERKYGALIFRTVESTSTKMKNMAEVWRVKLGKVFKLAGPFDMRPHPHRLRYTFVRILLEKGVPLADVAELIGDTEDVVRRHYAKWVPERQARLTGILREAFAEKGSCPSNVVEMPMTGTK